MASGLLLLLAVVDWSLLRSGVVSHPSWILTLLVVLSMSALVWQLWRAVTALLSARPRRGAALARALALLGLLVVLGAGLANWLLRLEGFVILQEGEKVSLRQGADLQFFEAGPLANLEEMELTIALDALELRAAGPGYFYPESRLLAQRGGSEVSPATVHPRKSAVVGALKLYQGAFGFAPRIVILRSGEAVFDEVVPFTSERREGSSLSFDGEFTLASEALHVTGALDLASLDEGLRGHATLHLTVERDDELIGRGSLLPGRFASIERGYRIGFAGLRKWSEIDVSRRHYGAGMLCGGGLMAVAGLVWVWALWRGR